MHLGKCRIILQCVEIGLALKTILLNHWYWAYFINMQSLNLHSIMNVIPSNISGIEVHFRQTLPHIPLNKWIFSERYMLIFYLLLEVHFWRSWTCIVVELHWSDGVTFCQVLLLLNIYLLLSFIETLLFRIANNIMKS